MHTLQPMRDIRGHSQAGMVLHLHASTGFRPGIHSAPILVKSVGKRSVTTMFEELPASFIMQEHIVCDRVCAAHPCQFYMTFSQDVQPIAFIHERQREMADGNSIRPDHKTKGDHSLTCGHLQVYTSGLALLNASHLSVVSVMTVGNSAVIALVTALASADFLCFFLIPAASLALLPYIPEQQSMLICSMLISEQVC